ncbi:MAG: hypothetical protein ACHQEM_05240, partial [Chitinophagales bacterium]
SGSKRIEVSQNHWLLCLDPIIIGVWMNKLDDIISSSNKNDFEIYFKEISTGALSSKDIAMMNLTLSAKIEEEGGTLYLLKCSKARIFHVLYWKAWLIYQRYYKKPGFSFTRLKEFAAAYSYPRKVRLVSFALDDYYNIFPMDLLGEIPGTNKYVFGLRHTNIALSKMIESRKLVVSEVSSLFKETIYLLGKHHASLPPPINALPFKVFRAEKLGFYIPEWVESYKEVKILKTLNLGSHMLMLGEWEKENKLTDTADHLFHIHFLLYLRKEMKKKNYPLV